LPKCPHCGMDINYLVAIAEEIIEYEFNGKEFIQTDVLESTVYDYKCPICGKTIAKTRVEAERFLGGRDHGSA